MHGVCFYVLQPSWSSSSICHGDRRRRHCSLPGTSPESTRRRLSQHYASMAKYQASCLPSHATLIHSDCTSEFGSYARTWFAKHSSFFIPIYQVQTSMGYQVVPFYFPNWLAASRLVIYTHPLYMLDLNTGMIFFATMQYCLPDISTLNYPKSFVQLKVCNPDDICLLYFLGTFIFCLWINRQMNEWQCCFSAKTCQVLLYSFLWQDYCNYFLPLHTSLNHPALVPDFNGHITRTSCSC